jgi:hypothetical protein
VTYTDAEGRQRILEVLAEATDELGLALAALGEAYELLDEHAAERLEERLFRPLRGAYGQAKRTYAAFAARSALPAREFPASPPGAPATGAKGFVEAAVEAASRADGELAALQDSMLPVDAGDAELRTGLARVRELLGGLRGAARELLRTLGR